MKYLPLALVFLLPMNANAAKSDHCKDFSKIVRDVAQYKMDGSTLPDVWPLIQPDLDKLPPELQEFSGQWLIDYYDDQDDDLWGMHPKVAKYAAKAACRNFMPDE